MFFAFTSVVFRKGHTHLRHHDHVFLLLDQFREIIGIPGHSDGDRTHELEAGEQFIGIALATA
jgi:hypothetical protein